VRWSRTSTFVDLAWDTDSVQTGLKAERPSSSEKWMNYLMRPDVMAAITNYIHYPNAHTASLPLVRASVKNDEAIYPGVLTVT
jgi:putrescine transport system substrate-binding protein